MKKLVIFLVLAVFSLNLLCIKHDDSLADISVLPIIHRDYRISFDIQNAHQQELGYDLFVFTTGNDYNDGIQFRGRHFYAPEGSEDKLRDMFKEFYRYRGKVFIEPRVHRFARMMGVKVEAVSVIDLKNRWASCSVKRSKVNFNWKIMMAPVSVINYLIVHELAHFKHKRHNKDFWNEVDKILPDYQKQAQWLKEYGAGLDV